MKYFPDHNGIGEPSGQICIFEHGARACIGDVEVSPNRAWHGDTVLVYDGCVTGIIQSSKAPIPGYIRRDKQKYGVNKKGMQIYLFRPLSEHYSPMLVASGARVDDGRAVYVLVSFLEWTVDQKYPRGQCEMVLGVSGDPVADALVRAHHHRLFEGNRRLVNEIWQSREFEDRRDYREACVFSIDPPGCLDIDDAVHVIEKSEGYYEVGVHIADVTAWFAAGSDIDREAAHRAFTVYLPNKQVTILPEQLAHDKCSLLPGQDRLALSCILKITSDASIVSYEFVQTVIRSRHALAYEDLDADRVPYDTRWSVAQLQALFGITDSHKLIEKLMLMANTCAGKRMELEGGLLRRQTQLFAEYVISRDGEDTRHNSIGEEHYTHFTSPIRRYADQIVHRLIKAQIAPDEFESIVVHQNAQQKKHRRFNRDSAILRFPADIQEATAAVLPFRFSEKHKTYKVDVRVNGIVFPLRMLKMCTNTLLQEDILEVRNPQTGEKVELMVGQELTVSIHRMPAEPRLADKVRLTCDMLNDLIKI